MRPVRLAILIVAGLLAASAASGAPLPIAEYRFDERAGTTLGDGSGAAPLANGAIVGATWTASPYRGALVLDGTDDYVDLGADNSKLDSITASAFAITGIARARSAGTLVARGDAWAGEQNKFVQVILAAVDATHVRLAAYIRGDAGEAAGTTSEAVGARAIKTGEWFHFAVVRTGGASSALHVYVDGALDGSDTTDIAGNITFDPAKGPRPLALGVSGLGAQLEGHAPGGYLNGDLALARIFGVALGSAEVLEQRRIDTAGVVTESFDADPGWTGIGNRSDGWSFGFGATAHAGGAAGEAGGIFTRSGEMALYADTDLGGALTPADAVDASGRFDITGITNWNAGFVIGWFDPTGASELGMAILEETATSVRVFARLTFADGTTLSGGPAVLTGLDADRAFTISYDPAGGGNAAGRLEVSISGAGGVALGLDLAAADRARAAAFSAFGFKAGAAPNPDTAITATAFVDDLAYTSARRAGATLFREAVLADGPYAYWRFDEASGTTAADSSGNGRAATYAGAVTLGVPTGLVRDTGSAIGLPTETAFVQSSGNLVGSGAFTIEAVIRSGPQRTGTVFWENETQISVETGGAIRARFYDDAGTTAANQFIITSPSLPVEGWHHVAFVNTGTAVILYVDGASAGTLATSGLPSRQGGVYVGRDESPGAFSGLVDEVAVYRSALPADRILAHSQAALLELWTFFGEDLSTASAPKTAGGRLASTPTATAARTAFLAAAGNRLARGVEDFEGFAVPVDGQVAISSAGLRFGALSVTAVAERVPFAPPDANFRLRNLAGGGMESGTHPVSGAQYLITNTEHEIRFTSGLNALGFHATDVEVFPLSLELYGGGALITSTAVRIPPPTAPDASVLFFGLVSNFAFDRVVFRGSSPSDGFAFDDITVGMPRARIWAGPAGAAWGHGARWSPLGVPASGDEVRIPAGSGSSVIAAAVTVRSLALLAGFGGAVTVNAPLSVEQDLVVTSGTLDVGPAGSLAVAGNVTVNGGTLKGSISGPGGPVTLTSGGTLMGNVTAGRPVIVGAGGRISPGE